MGFQRQSSTRRRLKGLVDSLDRILPEDWTAEELLAAVESLRGRRILRLPLPAKAPVGLCGLWLAGADYDVMFLRPSTNQHDTFHELGHMLLDHGVESPVQELVGLLTGADMSLDISTIRGARGASSYAPPEEYEAELLATMISTRIRRGGPRRDGMLRGF